MKILISVYDKTGIVEFSKKCVELGHEVISTGGTAKLLQESGVQFIPIENITKNPECFSGRVKSISFQIASGLLYRRDSQEDIQRLNELGLLSIDMVVCNLYPFSKHANECNEISKLVEMIDIGGPTMIRAAAKNYKWVSVVVDPKDYDNILNELSEYQKISDQTRFNLAAKAFALTSSYDLDIQNVFNLNRKENELVTLSSDEMKLRYGENPHQRSKIARIRNTHDQFTLANAPLLQGKELSYNNYLDADCAFKCVSELKQYFPNHYACVIVKHGNPCGVALSRDYATAIKAAWDCDSVSAFGSVIAFSDPVKISVMEYLSSKFIEVLIAPKFYSDALQALAVKKNLRVIEVPLKKSNYEYTVRSIHGGVLIQDEDASIPVEKLDVRTVNQFEKHSPDHIKFSQVIIKYLKSNTLALTSEDSNTIRILASGVGQPNRLDCIRLLISQKIKNLSKTELENSILVSDAFFPFRDSIDEIANIGVKAIIEPGGSIRDEEVIIAANENNISLGFTHIRSFRH